MICWSCETDAGAGLLCAACGVVLPPDTSADHFGVLGVERRYALDLAELEQRYKEMTKVLHPDRWARADARARRFSLLRTVQLNDAWRVLKDPVRRAEYMLAQRGIQVGGEEGTTKQGPDGTTRRMAVSQTLLFEVMELREALAEARAAGDHAKLAALAADVTGRRERSLALAAAELTSGKPRLDVAAGELVAVRYWQRFLDEVNADDHARGEVGGAG